MPDFGPWLPDLAKHGHPGLLRCDNVYPIANGYAPIGSFVDATPALDGWSGGGAFTHKTGATVLLSGNAAGLHRFSGGAWASQYAVATTGRWRFSQLRDLVVAVHGAAPVAYDLAANTAGLLGGSPPPAKYVTTCNDFTVLAGDPDNQRRISWSGFGNPEEWTPGTSQSGELDLPDGSAITGLAGGEVLLVFQRNKIHRLQYVGGETVWQRDEISREVGCIEASTICQAGRLVFFLSERGFMQTDGSTVSPIGAEKVDRTFFAINSRANLGNIYSAVDPRHYLACWSVPGSPGQIWAYNWVLDRWTSIRTSLKGVMQAFTANINVDAVDALYPGGMDAIPLPVDSPIFAGGDPRFYVVTVAGVVGTLTGPNLAASLETAFNELIPGRYARPYMTMPITDATSGMVLRLDARRRLGDGETVTAKSELRASGHMPVRSNGRYFRIGLDIAAGTTWSFVQGLEVERNLGGSR